MGKRQQTWMKTLIKILVAGGVLYICFENVYKKERKVTKAEIPTEIEQEADQLWVRELDIIPSAVPTAVPTEAPPTDAPPTNVPTAVPTDAPPTNVPTAVPTDAPPTDAPPTDAPPTDAPPTNVPTAVPTDTPPNKEVSADASKYEPVSFDKLPNLCQAWLQTDVRDASNKRSKIPLKCSRSGSATEADEKLTFQKISTLAKENLLKGLYFNREMNCVICSSTRLEIPLLSSVGSIKDVYNFLTNKTLRVLVATNPYNRISNQYLQADLDNAVSDFLSSDKGSHLPGSESKLCHTNMIKYDFIGKSETCGDKNKLRLLSGIDVPTNDWSVGVLAPGDVNFVTKRYSDDVDNFGFSPHQTRSEYHRWKLLPGRSFKGTFSKEPDWKTVLGTDDFASCHQRCNNSDICAAVSWKGGGSPEEFGYRKCFLFNNIPSADGIYNSEFDSAVKLSKLTPDDTFTAEG